jgi:hypothetical protein
MAELGQDIDETSAVVADIEVRGDMALDLRFASTERDEHAEGEKLTGGYLDADARVLVAEALGRKVALDVQLIVGRGGVEVLDDIAPDDLLLDRNALFLAVLGRGRGLARHGPTRRFAR